MNQTLDHPIQVPARRDKAGPRARVTWVKIARTTLVSQALLSIQTATHVFGMSVRPTLTVA